MYYFCYPDILRLDIGTKGKSRLRERIFLDGLAGGEIHMTREDKTRDYNYNKKRNLKKAKRMRRARRIRACLRVFALLIICQLLLFGMTAASAQRQEAKINLKLTDTAVIQGEEMPEIRDRKSVV